MERKYHTLEQSIEILSPIYDEVVECIKNSFDNYLQTKEYIQENFGYKKLENRTKGSLIHDFICEEMLSAFKEHPDVEIGLFNKIFGLNLSEDIFLRFKKMDSEKKVSSLKTKQHKKFMNQQQILGLPTQPTFVFAGYIPNSSWTVLNGVYLACWNGEILEWYDEAGNYSYEQISFEFEPDADYDIFEHNGSKLQVKRELKESRKNTGTK